MTDFKESPDSNVPFQDSEFHSKNESLADEWVSISKLYPVGRSQPLLPETFSREQFCQGDHYECFMLSALSTLVSHPEVIRNCFITKKVRQDGKYTFKFFRGKQWVKVEIDDRIPLVNGDTLYCQSPTQHWWPLLLEKAYAKFYTSYEHLEGCTLQETFHDITGLPVLNIPMDVKLAKAANCYVNDGAFWLEVARKIEAGEVVASVLTKGNGGFEEMGVEGEQQYGILEIFSLTGSSSIDDIAIHLHNPFEDEEYTGPLNSNDAAWTPKLRAKYSVDNPRSIFLPLVSLLKIVNSMQLGYLAPVILDEATYFDDEWKGVTAGGNPTSSQWRKNPLYYVSNLGHEAVTLSFVIKQPDERHLYGPDVEPSYKQCGMILSQYQYPRPIPTKFVTGNNHKSIHKSLFLNSREVSNSVSIPPNSLCYLVPSCMNRGDEAKFTLAVYRMAREDYSSITLKKLDLPEMNWEKPINVSVELQMRTKDRIDFYVDGETDVHILLHQKKPYISPKTGGDAMAQDFMGMYLYNDMDRKISGVHAATNYRETSIIHHLPNSGRYAISVTCPRGTGDVPAEVTIVTSKKVNSRQVDTPADAAALPDEDEDVEEGEGQQKKAARIDYDPINLPASKVTEVPDSSIPFEDKRFMLDNKDITNDPWIHIGDLYPEGKNKPLVPDEMDCEQFSQGEYYECCCLSAFATLVKNHPDVIRNVFVSKNPRRDGRYTFQFHRYGQWVKVEIDDRIPMLGDKTYFCRSPTHHWWPLLLEKAYAKFYTLYQNLEGCTLQEIYHDFTGCAVVSIPLKLDLANSAGYGISDPLFWVNLNNSLKLTAIGSISQAGKAESLGLNEDQGYGVLGFITTKANPKSLSDILVKLHNPFVDSVYTGPMSKTDRRWNAELLRECTPERQNEIYMPVDCFCDTFLNLQQAHFKDVVEPSWHFNSEWGEGTNGGNPTMVTWRENPLYVVRNSSDEAVTLISMVRQPDQRHILHTLPDHEPNYIQCGLVLSLSIVNQDIPTYLVTGNSHQMVHKGLFLNAREVANDIIIPPKSLSYLVPSAMHHEMGIFILSYWYKKREDERAVKIKRLRVNVARRLPAVAHVTLEPKGKDRVDFMVDCKTETHILLSQLKPSRQVGTDAMTEDFLGMYIYNDKDERVAGVIAATNFRETGLVTMLPKAGRYALSITCPQASGSVPCRVEIVATESAHVRITDAPEDALEFFDSEEVIRGDPNFENDRYVSAPMKQEGNAETKKEDSPREIPPVSAPAPEKDVPMTQKELAGQSFLKPEYLGIPVGDLPLAEDRKFVEKAHERKELLKDPIRNASKIQQLESGMHQDASEMAKVMHEKEREFLDQEPEGIPLDLLPLNEDPLFSELEDKLRRVKKAPVNSQSDIKTLENKLNARAHELAAKLKEEERLLFLNPKPLGIPYQALDLDNDPEFHEKEIERLRARHENPDDTRAISNLNSTLNKRAEELAKKKLGDGREAYLARDHLHVANKDLPLDENEQFLRLEAKRQDLLVDPAKNRAAIIQAERDLNDMATEMAKEFLAKQRPDYLQDEYHGNDRESLPLNDDDNFLLKERERRDLLDDPNADKSLILQIEQELNDEAGVKGKKINQDDRPNFLKPSYYNVARDKLPLDDDEKFEQMETKRAQLKKEPLRNKATIQNVEKSLNDRAAELAKKVVSGDRSYLDSNPEGVPLELLPLDTDPLFKKLEEERMDILSMSHPDLKALVNVEEKLNKRAHELAKEYIESLRPQYTRDLPISPGELSLNSDAPFIEMERKMMNLIKEDPIANKDQIKDIQEALRKRANELAKHKEEDARAQLDQNPLGIPLNEIGLDNDEKFLAIEQELKEAKENDASPDEIKALQERLQDRAYELAEEELARRVPEVQRMPGGVPLSQLKNLGNDKEFQDILNELDNARIKPTVQKGKQALLQQALNKRLEDLANELKEKEREGILGDLMQEVPADVLNNDETYTKLEEEWRELMKDPENNADHIAELEQQMRDRAKELADEQKWEDRESYLDKNPEGVPLRELGLDEDPKFLAMEEQRRELLKDPVKNARKIAELEKSMNDYVHELAKEKNAEELAQLLDGEQVDPEVLNNDPEFAKMHEEWRELMNDPKKNAKRIAELEQQMRDRAKELADEQKWEDRESYLDKNPEGVPLRELGLDEDPKFLAMEEQRRELLKDPVKNARKIAELEKSMNDYVHELAKEKNAEELAQLLDGEQVDPEVLNNDPEFAKMHEEWRELMNDPKKNAKRIAELEQQMRDRAKELADEQKWEDRESYLDKNPEGVPLRELGLDEDPKFLAMEEQRRELLKDPVKNARKIAELEKSMNDYVHELAKEKNAEELAQLLDGEQVDPEVLNNDPEFAKMHEEWRELMNDPKKNAKRIAELEQQMRDRAKELADEQKWEDRESYLDKNPEGVPLRELGLDEDPKFLAMEEQRRELLKDPVKNARKIAELEKSMNDYVHELAKEKNAEELAQLLDGEQVDPEVLNNDPEFAKMHEEWRELMNDPKKNAKRIAELEQQMRDRAKELADEQKWEDRESYLDKNPEGVPLRELGLDEDPKFLAMEEQRRELLKDPVKNARKIAELEKAMNDHVHDLAKQKKEKDRDIVLDGVKADHDTLANDPEFAAYEQERSALLRADPMRNAQRIAELEKKMKARAQELADEQKWEDRESYLDKNPEGVPLRELGLDEDPKFLAMEEQRRELLKDPVKNARKIAELEKSMNDYVHELAKEKNAEELAQLLDGEQVDPEVLNNDPEFAKMHEEWRELMNDPKKNAKRIAELEQQMRDRAKELADEQKWEDRESYLDKNPEGVPLRELGLDEDPKFLAMEEQRRELLKDPVKNARKIAELEKSMNDYVHELAKEKNAEELAQLLDGEQVDPEVLNNDPEFAKMHEEWRELMNDPKKNAKRIAELEQQMRDRAKELADEQKWEDRESYLDKNPEGVPLRELGLDEDPKFLAMEEQRRELLKDPVKNARKIAELEKAMNDHVHDLAKQKLADDRKNYLDANPAGIPLEEVFFDEDKEFKAMEEERARLKAEMEQRKKDAETARKLDSLGSYGNETKKLDRIFPGDDWDLVLDECPKEVDKAFKKGVSDAVGIPESSVVILNAKIGSLHFEYKIRDCNSSEPEINRRVAQHNFPELMALYKSRQIKKEETLDSKIKYLEQKMNLRAAEIAEAQKWADRESYLDKNPEGVPLRELGLDEDPKFLAMEEQRRELLKDPVKNARKIAELEKAMNDHVHDLAKQKKEKDRDIVLDGVKADHDTLANDPEFVAYEQERSALLRADPMRNAQRIAELEKKMKARAQELADEQKWADRESYLDKNPEGVPLRELGLDEDPKFLAMEEQRRELLKDPVKNARKIAELEKAMNDHVHDLAKQKLADDRKNYLDANPAGIPLEEVPLDEDPEFLAMERERAKLLAEDPVRNARKIADLEKKLNDRAKELAEAQKWADRESYLDKNPEGVPLRELGLDEDPKFLAMEEQRRELLKDPVKNARKIAELEKAMNDHVHDLAKQKKDADRSSFMNVPRGEGLDSELLSADPEFSAMENEWRELMKDPKKNAKRIAELEQQMRDRAKELADEQKWEDRESYLDKNPEGVPLRELGLDEDPKFLAMEEQRRELLKDPVKNARKIAELEKAMNDHVHDLAKQKLADDRKNYLDANPAGIPLEEVPLDEDPEFLAMERERAKLLAEDPVRNARKIADLEKKLNDRAKELAEAQKWADRESYLDKNPEGVPLRELGLDEDPKFLAMEEQRRELLKDPVKNARKIAELEKAMNDHVHDLAKQKLADDRKNYLDANPAGIPLEEVPLDEDPEFLAMERERAKLLAEDPVRNARKIADLEKKLNDRAKELAEAQKWADRESYLDKNPEGVPLRELGLDEDPKFLAMEEQRRELLKDPVKNARKIAELEKAMNDHVHDLAKQKLADDRKNYLDANPAGIPLEEVPLDEDPEFLAMERERAKLLAEDPVRNARKIADLEKKLNDRAKELAEAQKWADRESYLDKNPEGVPLRELGLDEDPKFLAMEEQRRELLKDPVKNARKIAELEKAMNDHVHDLAKQKLADDRKNYLDANPAGIPLEEVPLDEDPEFLAMERERAKLLAEDPVRNARKIADLEKKLNDRAKELAEAQKWADRESYLDKNPEGVPLRELGLDEDPKFLAMEEQRRELLKDPVKNARKIAELEKAMNDHVHDLAKQKKDADRSSFMNVPRGEGLDSELLSADPEFSAMENEWRELMKDPKKNAKRIAELEQQMRDRAKELADEQKWEDRESYLDKNPEGVPLRELGLDEDPKFLAMEEQRRELLKDPVKNARKIAELEKAMNDHVHDLAKQKLADDRKNYLDANPAGIPLEEVPLDEDPEFLAMERERAKLLAEDPVRNARKIADLEKKLNDRAKELAEAQKWADRESYLDKNPEGVPLRELGLDEDPKFLAMEEQRRELLKDPVKNARKIAELEKAMNDHVHDLAKQKKDADRSSFMNVPRGEGLDSELLSADPEFSAMENEWRELMKDPKKNAKRIAELEQQMRDRAKELADEQKWEDRESYLDKNPEGVPLRELGLDEDPKFLAMEEQRRELLKDPVKNARKIAELEKAMNDHVHDLAKQKLADDRKNYLDANPAGIPLEEVPLDEDPEFLAMERERAKLLAEDPVRNARKIADLEKKLNDRAKELAEAQKWADRESYLDKNPEGVPLRELGLDEDPKFLAMEEQRRELLKDPVKNARKIAELEKAMNDHVHDLAKQKLADDRKNYLDANPAGIPLEEVPLDEDPEFLAMERERAKLLAEDPVRNARKIADLEKKLNDRAKELAEAQKWADRESYLDKNPEGVPLRELGLDEDPKFLAMEEQRRELLKDPVKNARKIAELEKAMNDHVHDLAKQKKDADRSSFMNVPRGEGLDSELLSADPEFSAMENEWRELMKDPKKNAKRIAELEQQMRDRAKELADEQKWEDRESYLDKNPEGVPLRELGLDEDPKFLAMEEQRRELLKDPVKNARKIAELEKAMNDHVHDLAKQKKDADRSSFMNVPRGEGLDSELLSADPEFSAMENEWRELMKDPKKNAKRIAELEQQMRDRAKELADEQKWEDRESYLDKNPEGVPLRELGLDEDPKFLAMEEQRRELLKDPVKNARKIAELEKAMNDHVHDLAKQKLADDRKNYLDANPAGIPLEEVPLDEDPEFLAMERERAKLLAEDPVRNARKIADLEKKLNDRAKELAEAQKWADRESYLDKNPEGVPLRELGLDEDPKFLAMEEQRRELLKDPVKNARKIAELEKAMNDHVHDLAKQKLADDRKNYLDANPAGIPLEEVPLDEDPEFLAMERERAKLLAEDPVRNARKIADLEKKLNDRAKELAEAQKWADRESYLDKNPEGVPLRELGLDEDPKFLAMEEQRRELLKDPVKNARKIAELEKAMNDHVHDLAKQKKDADRSSFMNVPRGEGLDSELLSADPEFSAMENEWRELMKDPKKNAKRIAELEQQMRDRAKELADEQKWEDRESYLDKNPEGVPLRELGLDEDPKFLAMEEQRRELLKDPVKNARKIAELEKAMNDHVHDLAKQKLADDRKNYLDANPAGIPLEEVPLDEDPEFLAMERERAKLLAEDPVRNARKIADLEKKLNDRAKELAEAQKWADRESYLDKNPEGVPLRELGLDEDPKFLAMEEQRRELLKDPVKNARKIAELEKAMNDHVHDLAKQKLADDRKNYLDANPAGIPLEEVPLDEDPEFLAMERERAKLLAEDPVRNARKIADLEKKLNDRAKELAEAQKWADRESYLDKNPEGVPLRELGLDEDPKFLAMEEQRRELLKDPVKNARKIAELEKAMNDHVHDLAKQKKDADRSSFMNVPRGEGLDSELLSADPEFSAMENEWRELMKDPKKNAKRIAELEQQMRDRAKELADEQKWEDRESYLDKNPEGVPLRELGLDEDPKFLAMEEQRRELLKDPVKNARKIAELEKAMNDHVHDLAKQKLADDRKNYLDANPAGIPLEEVPLDEDPEFLRMEDERDLLLKKGANRSDSKVRSLEEKLNKRAEELANAVKWSDREFLDPFPEGIPLSLLGLDQDGEFLRLERARKALIDEDPEANAHRIANLEDAMNDRAHELALEFKKKQMNFLDSNPLNVPLSLLDLDNDPVFKDCQERLWALLSDPRANKDEISKLKKEMNEYVLNKAKEFKERDRKRFLDQFPEGVDINSVPLDSDELFKRLEAERYRLFAEDPVKNANRIAAIEAQMNKRAHELAKRQLNGGIADRSIPASNAQKSLDALDTARAALARETDAAERKKLVNELQSILRPDSYGLPLDLIPIKDDHDSMDLLKKYRKLHANPRKKDEAEITRQKLQGRVDGVAYDVLFGDKETYLSPNVNKIPVHNDPEFRDLALRRVLLEGDDPVRNAEEVGEIEKALNDRAHDLGDKWDQRLTYLDNNPEGVAIFDVPLDCDDQFVSYEDRFNTCLRNGGSAAEIQNLQEELRDRACELALQVQKEDLKYLRPAYNSVPTSELNLHAYPEFQSLANQNRAIRLDGKNPASDADPVVDKMDQFADALATQGRSTEYPFMDANPGGIPLDKLNLERDSEFERLRKEHDTLKKDSRNTNDPRLQDLENLMNARAHQLAREKNVASGLNSAKKDYLGVPTEYLNLPNDPIAASILEELGKAQRDPKASSENIRKLKDALDNRANELAAKYLANERSAFLPRNPRGVPLEDLHLDEDPTYKAMERELLRLMKEEPNSEAVEDMKYKINEYVDNLARELLRREREKFMNPAPGGVPLNELHDLLENDPLFAELEAERYRLSKDPRNQARVRELEARLNKRAEELAKQNGGAYSRSGVPVTDPVFSNETNTVADHWRRIGDIYPEGRKKALVPENPNASDVESAPGDLTYLGPFLAALSRDPPLIQRLFGSKTHPTGNNPYNFVFFDPNSNPVSVEIDDTIPCDREGQPVYTRSPTGEWWPLLVEKAYAKFVGGYSRMDDCTSHETLRDLTGRPVTHLPLDSKLAKEVHDCDFRNIKFWQKIRQSLSKGDVYIAVSNDVVPDGIHAKCHYAIFDVIESVPGSSDPSDTIVKIHNCFIDEPFYDGPLNADDSNWSSKLRAICNCDPKNTEFLFLPQPVFLRNFSSLQRCHINCGDRLTVAGEWNDLCSGGNPKYTTFRTNPIYLLENKGNRPAVVLAELRHSSPVFYDANNVGVYHASSLALLRPDNSIKLVAPLLTHNTHKFITKGLISDARETSMEVELPPNSTCYLVPYTKKKGSFGSFQVSVYPQENPVNLTTLRPIDETHNCISTETVVVPGSGEGARIDFTVGSRCDLHILVHQDKVSDPSALKKGDYLGEDELMMAAYENNNMLVASTGDATNARDHSIAFQTNNAGRYTLLIGCPSRPVSGDCPCTVTIYAPRHVDVNFLPPPAATRQPIAPNRPGRPASASQVQNSQVTRTRRPSH